MAGIIPKALNDKIKSPTIANVPPPARAVLVLMGFNI
jgi:hypothetical protein